MQKSSKIILGILSGLTLFGLLTIGSPTSYSSPMRGYSNAVVLEKHFVTVRQGGSANYYSDGSYTSGRSYSSGGSSYGK